jgi:hypothetical protein
MFERPVSVAAADAALRTRAENMLLREAQTLGFNRPVKIEHWRPNSNRKEKVRHFATLISEGRPRLVAKLRTDPEDVKVSRERDVLIKLSSAGGSASQLYRSGGDEGFVMAFVPDEDLPIVFRRSSPRYRLDLVRTLIDTIWEFHRARLTRQIPLTETVLDDLLGGWRPCDEACEALIAVPTGAMHGDLGPWNIRVCAESNELSILDWEDFRFEGLPALDVLNALLTLTLLVHPDHSAVNGKALYRQTFIERGEMPLLLREGLSRYAAMAGIEAAACLALTPVYCRGMLKRFEAEGRPTAHLFYIPFLQHFKLKEAVWLLQ